MICMLRTMEYPELRRSIGKGHRIALMTCSVCVRQCGLGGPEVMESLKVRLERDGYDVVATICTSAPCLSDRIRHDLPEFDVAIPITCEEAVWNLRRAFPDKRFIEIMRTIGSCVMDGDIPMLIKTVDGVDIKVPEEGIPLVEAAKALGMHATPFS